MIIVTGGFGFIGSNIVEELNNRNVNDIIIVDKVRIPQHKKLKFKKFVNYKNLFKFLKLKKNVKKIKIIFHQGANSSTVGKNLTEYINDNFIYTKKIIDFSIRNKIKVIYASSASVYGINNKDFKETSFPLYPENNYGLSKALVDYYVLNVIGKNKNAKIVGLRYFNVYGPKENHKKRMASVIFNFRKQLVRDKKINLFKGSGGFSNGEQKRDFVHVKDCVNVNLWFWKKNIRGIFNVGTGKAISFNKIAKEVQKNLKYQDTKINYINIPKDILRNYQSFTKADISKLRKAGYKKKFISYREGVKSYINLLNSS